VAESKVCNECQGEMLPIVVMDHDSFASVSKEPKVLQYRSPDDRRNFWTGKYPTAGAVRSFMCQECGRIAMYGLPANAQEPRTVG